MSETIDSPRTLESDSSIGPRFVNVTSLSKTGHHRIAYTEWGDPAASKVAICVHGLTRQGRDFDPLAVALAERGYRVLCPDLPGRGRSEWLKDSNGYDLQQYVTDMSMVIARARVEHVDWIGTSLGGLIGMVMASMKASPLRRMVVNDVGPYLPSHALSRLGKYLWSMPKSFGNFHAAEAYFREILAPYGPLGDSEWFHLTTHSIVRGADGRFRLLIDPGIGRLFKNVMYYSVNMWPQWDRVSCPVLILRGQYSDLLTPEIAREMSGRGPASKLIEFPDCGHAPALMDYRQIGPVVKWLTQPD
jgi:pimeloyl-ACP methyl ester carboxylesterase